MPNRYGCLNHHRRAICTNSRTIRRDRLEERTLAGLKERLVAPQNVRAAVEGYAAHINELNRERLAQAETHPAAQAKIKKGIAGMIAAIEDGRYQPAMKARMTLVTSQVSAGSGGRTRSGQKQNGREAFRPPAHFCPVLLGVSGRASRWHRDSSRSDDRTNARRL